MVQGRPSVDINDILAKVSEGDILSHYLGISNIPCIINSPLRQDNHPSFGLYTRNGSKISYKDFSTKECGGTFDLLQRLWNCSFEDCLIKINNDLNLSNKNIKINITKKSRCSNSTIKSDIDLQCKIREWRDYDIKYWESYGISLKWLKFAEVYPISHKIIIKNGKQYTFGADKYAYCFVERKEGHVSLKLYQPYNTNGYKWSNKHDGSVISLWSKLPPKGEKVVICSSLKDALCLSCNTSIPTLALQGEGYSISKTAVNELKKRFNKVFILFDNDNAGINDSYKLAEETGFTNITLPKFKGGKDVSDLFKARGKEEWSYIMNFLLNPPEPSQDDDIPF